MDRHTKSPRAGWQAKVAEAGVTYHTTDEGQPYWDESAYYSFSMGEILRLEKATEELQEMCLAAVQHVIDRKRYAQLGIPAHAYALIERSWNAEDPAIYGRFDLAYDGHGEPKLLEYNADTPTSLVEAASAQWFWMEECFPGRDQWNSIHERLLDKWRELRGYLKDGPLYFTSVEDREDYMTVTYLRDLASQAGIATREIPIGKLGWSPDLERFVDGDDVQINNCFKLYPWEWLVHEEFGKYLPAVTDDMFWIEPAWKMVLSNKGILPILHELYPSSPYLLKAQFTPPREHANLRGFQQSWVKKPKLSREGANVTVIRDGLVAAQTGGEYGEEGYIWQEFAPPPDFGTNFPVLGAWVIDGAAAGMGIRESHGLVTDNTSRFVPHVIL